MNISGVINIYKEAGYTSHDVVAIVRRLFSNIKVGKKMIIKVICNRWRMRSKN